MPVLNGTIEPEGALVPIILGWGAAHVALLRAAAKAIPQPVSAGALLDSGAEVTSVDPSLVQALGLPLDSFSLTNLPAGGGLTVATQYFAALTIVHPSGNAALNLVLSDLLVVELPLGPLGYRALIGRDVLARCRFLYNGPRGRFRLAY